MGLRVSGVAALFCSIFWAARCSFSLSFQCALYSGFTKVLQYCAWTFLPHEKRRMKRVVCKVVRMLQSYCVLVKRNFTMCILKIAKLAVPLIQ
jgi:hypothetical protein